ncbi:MAG: PLP-dependent aminotransferase family protein [Ignisphaera sp.]
MPWWYLFGTIDLYNLYSNNGGKLDTIKRYVLQFPESSNIINFASGVPDPSTFPLKEIRDALENVLRERASEALQYTPSQGVAEYRKSLANFIYRMRCIKVSPDNILVVSGAQQAIDLITRLFVDPGDIVLVEEPGYIAALNVFRVGGAELVGIPIDGYGMDVDYMEEMIKGFSRGGRRIKFVYTVATAQNPTGITMNLDRRRRLVELAYRYNFIVIEDDTYGLLYYGNEDIKPLAALDPYGVVIYISSLSKVLAPSLRLGCIIADTDTIEKLTVLKHITDLTTSSLSQYVARELIENGVLERNIGEIRKLYRRKRNTVVEIIEEEFPKDSSYTNPSGGFFTWIKLNSRIDTEELLEKALTRNVIFTPGHGFYCNRDVRDAMRISFSKPSEDQIRIGLNILANLIKMSTTR